MNRAFNVIVEVGRRLYGREYVVIAPNAPTAIKKACRAAARETKTYIRRWRCVNIAENDRTVLL
jgi:hypothetical protein